MKKSMIGAFIAAVLTGAAGFWLGYQVQNPTMTSDVSLMVTCGGGDFPKEAFRKVNAEIESKMNQFYPKSDHLDWFVAVVPEISGYRIRMAGERGAPIYDDSRREKLTDWIHERMEQIQREEFQAQQGAAQNPVKR
jgi:hypothetical protein